jgi:Site-specific DNA methylase
MLKIPNGDSCESLPNLPQKSNRTLSRWKTSHRFSATRAVPFSESLRQFLTQLDYPVRVTIAKCELFGVPQKRRRLVVVAARGKKIGRLVPAENVGMTVKNAIAHLPPIKAGEAHPDDPLHAASSLSELNLRRMKAAKPGGTWRDWPEDLRAACHRRPTGKTYPGVYARMSWDEPAPTMTTQCFGFGNGRFGHPEQDRAISLREAAILQSFPPEYEFLPSGELPKMKEVGKWIGNAVPVELGRSIGNTILAEI